MVDRARFELAAFPVQAGRSTRLSYRPKLCPIKHSFCFTNYLFDNVLEQIWFEAYFSKGFCSSKTLINWQSKVFISALFLGSVSGNFTEVNDASIKARE